MKKTNLRPNPTLLFIRGMIRLIVVIGALVLLAVSLGALTSCSSVKKIKKSETNRRDSVVVISETALSSKTKDSIGERTAKTIQAGNTIIELGDDDQDGGWYSDSTTTKEKINPKDYEPTTSITLPGGGQITTRQKIKSIITSGNVTNEENTKAEVHSKDTSSNAQAKSVSVKDESGSSSSNVRRTNWTMLIIGSIILLILLIVGRIIYKQYFEKTKN